MAQLFKPSANTFATISLFLGAALPFGLFLTGSQITRGPINTKVTVPIDQPVPFSHKHHTKELGIDCRFCHYTVEYAAHASVPPTEVCMTCHSQIWTNSPNLEPVRSSWATGTSLEWNKVNAVPDFVYFNHSIHIARGVSCNNCHGPVQEMAITWKGQPFRMAWCLECHKDPSKFMYTTTDAKNEDGVPVSPKEQVFALYRKIAAGDPLTEVEKKLAEGLEQSIPSDKVHEGYQLMTERKINKSQLTDCSVCHH